MKQSILLLTLFLLICTSMHSQDLTNSTNTFVRFSVTFTGILDKMDPYETTTKKEEAILKKNREKLYQILYDQMYGYFTDKLSDKQVEIEDIAVLTDRGVIYLKEGYPNPMSAKSAIKKAIKKGHTTDYYLDVRISVGETLDVLGGKLTRQVKPTTTVVINVLDNEGNKLVKLEETIKAEKRLKSTQVVSSGGGFDKLDADHYPLLVSALTPILHECIDSAVDQL